METIGDAYCVAGGLHKESETHAVQIALMALKMMELSDEVRTPTGEPIKVSVTAYLLHSVKPSLESPFQNGTELHKKLPGQESFVHKTDFQAFLLLCHLLKM